MASSKTQEYCHCISKHITPELTKLGCHVENIEFRAKYLFGINFPNQVNLDDIKQTLKINDVFVFIRVKYIGISCHLYTTKKDSDNLLKCLTEVL